MKRDPRPISLDRRRTSGPLLRGLLPLLLLALPATADGPGQGPPAADGASVPELGGVPVIQESQKLGPSAPVVFHQFGFSASMDGSVAALGAPSGDHRVYVFKRDQEGPEPWREARLLDSPVVGTDGSFGWAVALEGDTLVVGAISANDPQSGIGAAYIYRCDEGGPDNWGLLKRILPSDLGANQAFGSAVAIRGDLIAVGNRRGIGGGFGQVYVFERDAGGPDNWGEIAIIPSPAASNSFGADALSLSGDILAVGALSDDTRDSFAGAVYVFERDRGGPGNWGLAKRLIGSGVGLGDEFGTSVALQGNELFAGSPGEDVDPDPNVDFSGGAVYVFQRDADGPDQWGQTARIILENPVPQSQFSSGLAVDGDVMVAGTSSLFGQGFAYIFRRDPLDASRWLETLRLLSSDLEGGDRFGAAVGINGSEALVTARFHNPPDFFNLGAGYIFPHAQPVFSDGFESGDLSAWSASVP